MRWAEDPARPHSCPQGAICIEPGEPGVIGDKATTGCVASDTDDTDLGGTDGEGEGEGGQGTGGG